MFRHGKLWNILRRNEGWLAIYSRRKTFLSCAPEIHHRRLSKVDARISFSAPPRLAKHLWGKIYFALIRPDEIMTVCFLIHLFSLAHTTPIASILISFRAHWWKEEAWKIKEEGSVDVFMKLLLLNVILIHEHANDQLHRGNYSLLKTWSNVWRPKWWEQLR